MAGRFEADLGGGVCKKRIATVGRGKSGATRTLVAKESELAIFFLVGRQKSDSGADFSDRDVAITKFVAKGLQAANLSKIEELKADGTIEEICDEQDDEQEGDEPSGE